MAATPWLTSNQLVQTLKRKVSAPTAQTLFTDEDYLAFINDELAISQVPSILLLHEEFFVYSLDVPMRVNKSRYPIPDRAIGMKLRDLFWKDSSGSLYQMTQITEEDKAYFQRSIGNNQAIHKYYVEGNDIVLSPTPTGESAGQLVFVFFLRPNQLVADDRAAIISGFSKTVTVNNTGLVVGDTVTIDGQIFTAVSGSPAANEFQIGGSSIITATNLAQSINTNGIVTANNGTPSTAIVTLTYTDLEAEFTTSNSSSMSIQVAQGVVFSSIPTHITASTYIDFLQTKPGHKIRSYDVLIPTGGVSGTTINFTNGTVPSDLVVGDYICVANECIIPQIPPDLHNGLAERAGARVLAAMGDVTGLQIASAKIEEIDKSQGTLLDSRVDGSPRKITAKHSLLHWGRFGTRRRF